ncbi:MAG: pseudouridine synthase [Burkholderiaceae bacterium]|nr:pseudouridine synthase [Burkholderiaceae bacterium]
MGSGVSPGLSPPGQPPAREGVGASCVVTPAGNWGTLLDFLDARMPAVGRSLWQARMAGGLVLDADGLAVSPASLFRPGQRLYYYRSVPVEPTIPGLETVVFQDERLVVADKPHGLPVTPSGPYLQQTLLVRLRRRLGLETLTPIHRIDRETAGLVLFVVRPADRDAYHALFRQHAVTKSYEALAAVPGRLDLPLVRRSRLQTDPSAFFRMCEVEGTPNSQTRISLQVQRDGVACYHLQPKTGQRHQLRVHMNALGLPIAGDQLYPRALLGPGEADDGRTPLQLIARRLAFTDPVTGRPRCFESTRTLDWSVARACLQPTS